MTSATVGGSGAFASSAICHRWSCLARSAFSLASLASCCASVAGHSARMRATMSCAGFSIRYRFDMRRSVASVGNVSTVRSCISNRLYVKE